MQTFRISVKAIALRNYLVQANDLEEALRLWPSELPETEEIVSEEAPVIVEHLKFTGEWDILDLPQEYA